MGIENGALRVLHVDKLDVSVVFRLRQARRARPHSVNYRQEGQGRCLSPRAYLGTHGPRAVVQRLVNVLDVAERAELFTKVHLPDTRGNRANVN